VALLGVTVASTAVALYQLWPDVHLGLFFDEAWRADPVYSSDPLARMVDGRVTPTAPGWVGLFKIALGPFGHTSAGLRLANVACFVAFCAVTYLTIRRIGRMGRQPAAPPWVAAVTAISLPLLPGFASVYDYFNNYSFEALYIATGLLLGTMLGTNRWSFGALAVIIATSPLFVIGGLLAVPALVAIAAWWARGTQHARQRYATLAASCGIAVVVVLTDYATLYAPARTSSLSSYWSSETLAGADGNLLRLLWSSAVDFRDGLVGWSPAYDVVWFRWGLSFALAGAAAVGVVSILRRWPWYLLPVVTGQILAVVASAAFDWPVTAVRVNLAWIAPLYVTAVYGAFVAIDALTQRLRPTVVARAAAVALTAVVLLALAHEPPRADPEHFARTLPDDLAVIAESPARENLVLSYHFMSHWYTHDALVNQQHGDRSFTVLAEDEGDPSLATGATELSYEWLGPGDAVWCVIPYALGPEAAAESCQFDRHDLEPLATYHGEHAEIRGYLLP
jgi:hypothetical protein